MVCWTKTIVLPCKGDDQEGQDPDLGRGYEQVSFPLSPFHIWQKQLNVFSSSVDHQTESIMQEIVDTEFKHTTVLAIMHRLNHVTKYDKVALLDHGELIEFDEPSKLIAADSQFAELWRSSSK